MDDGIDRALQLPAALGVAFEHRNAKRAERLDDMLAQHPQGLGGVRRDEYALPLRQQVPDQIRDRVRLPGAGRSLDEHAAMPIQTLRDTYLLRIRGLAEENIGLATTPGVRRRRFIPRRSRAAGDLNSYDVEQ